jgi:cold-inducible RNA-binding protein
MTMKLFVAGIPYDFDDIDLKEMFELYGEVISAKVAIDRETRKSRGFGFLEMSVALEAKEAIDALNGARLRGGKELVVREAEDKPRGDNRDSRDNRNSGGGGYRPRR